MGAAEMEAQRRLQEDTGSIEPIDVEIAGPAVPSADEQSPSTPIAPIPAVKAATVKRLSSLARAQIGVAVVASLGVVAALAIFVPGSGGRESGGQEAVRPAATSTAEAGRPSPTAQATGTPPAGTARPSSQSTADGGQPTPEASTSDAPQPDAGHQYDAGDRDPADTDAAEAAAPARAEGDEPGGQPSDQKEEPQPKAPEPPHQAPAPEANVLQPQPTGQPTEPGDTEP